MPDLPEPLILSAQATLAWSDTAGIQTVELVLAEGDVVVLAADDIGQVATTLTDDGDVVLEVVDGQDFMAMAAQLLRLRGLADESWISPEGTTEYVRVDQWVLTVADQFDSPVHLVCPSADDAHLALEGWVLAHGGTL
jgi:hypothetical protein